MFILLFSLFVLFNNFKFKILILNSNNKNVTIYDKKIKKITQNTIKKIKNFNGDDNRNLTIPNIYIKKHDIDIENLTILFEKYELLKKIKNNEYQNLKINIINISNGRLLEDWNFNF
jgi:GH25 family lysozyme M1 (1,4-beta-N-acetylmuramidase)